VKEKERVVKKVRSTREKRTKRERVPFVTKFLKGLSGGRRRKSILKEKGERLYQPQESGQAAGEGRVEELFVVPHRGSPKEVLRSHERERRSRSSYIKN